MKLLRKINPAKWKNNDWASIEKIPSDALTLCMKTSGNTLSFWRIEDDKGEDESILALLGTQDRIEKIDIAFIEGEKLAGVEFEHNEGDTVFEELRNLHVDAANLDQETFLSTAKVLGSEIFENKTRRLTKAEFKNRIQSALDNRRVSWNSIPETMRKELKEPVN